jgi:hypothetical protein
MVNTIKEIKLDSCGSVSLAHSRYLSSIKPCSQYNIPIVTLNGIGGRTQPITNAGILTHVTPQKKLIKFLCYVFDTPIGNTQEMLLLGLKTIVEADIDIRYHMKTSVQGVTTMVRFLEEEEICNTKLHRVEMLYYKDSDTNSLENESAVDRYKMLTLAVYCYSSTAVQLAVHFFCCLCTLLWRLGSYKSPKLSSYSHIKPFLRYLWSKGRLSEPSGKGLSVDPPHGPS